MQLDYETPPLAVGGKATRIDLFSFKTPNMRAFHMSWLGFFVCFIAWFGIAPLMYVVRPELKLNDEQIRNIMVASVAGTIFARIFIGWLCDRIGPRLTYTGLLILGAIPVMCLGLAHSYMSFMLLRLAIGCIGASFVITQYHTSVMFAPNCVGTANATTAGWGNMGGGVTQGLMPVIFAGLMLVGLTSAASWRVAMIIPGVLMIATGICYFKFTVDAPGGNLADLKRLGREGEAKKAKGSLADAARDPRVWALAIIYAACFGIELTIHNVASLYFIDRFHMSGMAGGLIVGGFGMLAIFARSLGGYISDKASLRMGAQARPVILALSVFIQGLLLVLFSRMNMPAMAVASLILFGLFVHMSCGATYAIIPFINKNAVGSVAGIVGAGGNVGAVLSALLFGGKYPRQTAFLMLGIAVMCCAGAALMARIAVEPESKTATGEMPTDLAPTPA